MQQPRRSLSASNLPVNTNSSNNTTNNNNNGSSNTPVVESVHQDKRINYHELMQMLGTENLQHASLMMGASMHPNNVDPTTPLSANSHHHLASFVHPNATAQISTTQLLLEELNSAVDHTHHQATLQMLASGTNTESNNSNAPTTTGNSIVNNGSTAALLSAAAGHHPYHYYPSQYSPYLYHPLSHPIHPIHFSSHTPLAALYDQSAAAAVLLQQQQLLNHSLHSLPTASSTATINPQQQQQSTATVQQPTTTTISNNNTVSNVVVNQNIPSQQTSQNVQNITSNTDEEIEDDSDSKPMDCKKEGDNTSECEENREWSNCQVNRDFLDSSNVQVNIYLETRDSGPRNDSIVESELYSSIKYEMRHEIKCLKFLNESDNDLQLFCRVQIIHPDNKNEVLKNGKTILGGVVESNVSKGNANENIASTSMKIKFTDCSYHHGNCKFAFRVSYFIESDLDNPILIKESASFKVLARKPSKNKTKKQASKRKRKEEEAEINTVTTTTTPQSSPQKVKISSFDDFKQVTTSVFDYIQTNTDEQKKRQMINYVITKLYSVDPNIMFSLPTDDGANDIFKGLL